MKRRGLLLWGLLLAWPPWLSAQDTSWTALFNGRDLTGWAHVGRGRFVVEDGVLRTEGGMGLLWYTARPFQDVVLRVVYRNPGGANAGVFVRIPEPPADPRMPVHRAYEVQIDDDADDHHATGVLYSMTKARARPGRPEAWNVLEVTLEGDRTVVAVNGVVVTDYREGQPVRRRRWWWEPRRGPRPREGYVGLQNHSRRDTVYFREVSVKALQDAGF
jgi:hypothetical protein